LDSGNAVNSLQPSMVLSAGPVMVGAVLSVTVNTWSTEVNFPHASVMVYVRVMVPLQLLPANALVVEVTVKSSEMCSYRLHRHQPSQKFTDCCCRYRNTN
jgi:hypothetical protein